MNTTVGKTRCVTCGKDKATMRCGGCLEEYCYKHLGDHRQGLNKQLDEIEVNRDLFRQALTHQTEQPQNHLLIQEIDQWEQKSTKVIEQIAEEARKVVLKSANECIDQLEIKLSKLTDQLRESRSDDDFNEINLCQFQAELDRLTEELSKPSNISIEEDSTSFISRISVHVPELVLKPNIQHNTRWIINGTTVAGGTGFGNALNQLSCPCSVYVDDDSQTMYVADNLNHRIIAWKSDATSGEIVAGGNEQGNETNQLSCPTDVVVDREENSLIICDQGNRRIVRWPLRNGNSGEVFISDIDCHRLTMDNNGCVYISDENKDEVRRWKLGDINGVLVAGGNGKGNGLNQLNSPTFIVVDEDHSVYVSDCHNHRVMKWMKGGTEGIIVAGGQGEGNSLTQLACPEGLIVDHLGAVYVVDYNNHRIMRWDKGATQGNIVVGGNGKGNQMNQLSNPMGLSTDLQRNLYVADWNNYRIQRFAIDRN